MNVVNRVTLQHMKKNKRRTLVTILGVIISVAMITAVAALVVSFMNLLQRHTITETGDWHVLYQNVPESGLALLKNQENTKKMGLSESAGTAKPDVLKETNRPYFFLTAYNADEFSMLPVKLKEGRLPETPSELVLPDTVLSLANYQLGDRISLPCGNREKPSDGTVMYNQNQGKPVNLEDSAYVKGETFSQTGAKEYTIVGFLDGDPGNRWSPGFAGYTGLETQAGRNYNVKVSLNHLSRGLYQEAEALAKQTGAEGVSFNHNLLAYYGIAQDHSLLITVGGACAVVGLIILIGSVSLIHNSFSISLSERRRVLGMLSSVGATRRQKRLSVLFEGAVIGGIAIPLGMICGLGGMGITFLGINPLLQKLGIDVPLRLVVSPWAIFIAFLLSVIMIFLSAWIPARQASKVSPMEAIRQSQDRKVQKRQIKTSRLTQRLFGFEGSVALKNLKRNRHRYLVTLFSLSISVVLFLSAASFSYYMGKSYTLVRSEDIDADVVVSAAHTDDSFLEQATHLPAVKTAFSYRKFYCFSELSKEQLTPALQKTFDTPADTYPFELNFFALDDDSLRAYCKSAGVEESSAIEQGKAILINHGKLRQDRHYTELDLTTLRAGDTFTFRLSEDGPSAAQSIVLAAAVSERPASISSAMENNDTLSLVISRSTLQSLIEKSPESAGTDPWTKIFLTSDQVSELESQLADLTANHTIGNISIANVQKDREKGQQLSFLISLFVYAFVILIAAVCTANIFNTISTGMALRQREFAMLKSVGMTPREFRRMIRYESLFYGLKSLLYSLPVSAVVMVGIYQILKRNFSFPFTVPWIPVLIAVGSVFLVVGASMLYSRHKLKGSSIVEALKDETT